ncbi:MAG: hypothetical protein H0V93_04575 [Euzebyales bacterium]|nr:hypothetical protein [Euzebyales bacterium]
MTGTALTPGRPPVTDLLADLARGILRIRLVAVALTILSLPTAVVQTQALSIALVVAMAVSVIPLLSWDRVGPALLRHPLLLTLDAVVALGVMLVAGPHSPFFYFTLGTAALGGLLYRWVGATLFSLIMLAGYGLVVTFAARLIDIDPTFHNLVGIPALYPIIGAVGAGIRALLDRQAATEERLEHANARAAAAEERTRLARELHDSLGKTLHGIQLAAAALPHRISAEPQRAGADAEAIARAALVAASQARALITGLRSGPDHGSLREALETRIGSWRDGGDIEVELSLDEIQRLGPDTCDELVAIAEEALHNVTHHAQASHVRVDLAIDDDCAVLRIVDDGIGFEVPAHLATLADAGHFGLVGLHERAERAGGRLHVRSRPGEGTAIAVRVPLSASDMEALV